MVAALKEAHNELSSQFSFCRIEGCLITPLSNYILDVRGSGCDTMTTIASKRRANKM